MSTLYPYVCERCKNAPLKNGFRRTYKWKTQRGIDNHKCWTEAAEKRHLSAVKTAETRKENERIAEEKRREDWNKRMDERTATSKHKIGDEVCVSTYTVTRPTHEQRFNRMVRVRYDEERRYYSARMWIREITMWGYRESVGFTREFTDSDIFPTMEEAEQATKERAAAYKQHCEDAARCR